MFSFSHGRDTEGHTECFLLATEGTRRGTRNVSFSHGRDTEGNTECFLLGTDDADLHGFLLLGLGKITS